MAPARVNALSIVVPARNVAPTIAEQLDALAAQEWDKGWNVIVVDNGSTDATPEIVRKYAEHDTRFRLVQAPDGHGVSFVRNVGIANADAPAIAICDGDDIVGPKWVAAMGDALSDHEVVTGPMDVDSLNPPWLVATRGGFPDDRPRDYLGLFPLVPGGNVGMRVDVWRRIGRYDETFSGPEDADFSLRLWLHGVPVHFAPDAVLQYRYRPDRRDLFRQGRFYGRGRPLVNKRIRASGRAAPPRFAGWKSWAALIAGLSKLTTPEGRATWCWIAGNRLGNVEGSIRHRALYL
jgi:glycosyltransferase involved in cell wall biosynthesis